MRGAATGKARLPTVESLTEGTTRRLVPAERSVRLINSTFELVELIYLNESYSIHSALILYISKML